VQLLLAQKACKPLHTVEAKLSTVLCSVPQGSVLRLLLFLLYTADLAELAARYGAYMLTLMTIKFLYLSCKTD